MPYRQYYFLKQAIDFEMLRQRKLFISDVAVAFSDPQKGVKQLEDQERKLTLVYRSSQVDPSASISWDFNPNAAEQLKRWQR